MTRAVKLNEQHTFTRSSNCHTTFRPSQTENFSLNLPPDSKAELQSLLRLLSTRMMIEQTPPALHPPDTRGVKIISVVWVWLRAEDPPLYNN